MSENSLQKFQNLLRTLFQFDYADLDFGIYRILNYKRKQIEEFITKRLPGIVEDAFGKYAAAERKDAEQEVERLRQEGQKRLGADAFDAQGKLKFVFHETPLGKEYLQAIEKAKAVQVANELKTRVYNDLYTFFSRYYDEGDFVSKRRYGRNETYAIPYNGEEVVLHWANRDQYYIKTGENFKTYRFRVSDHTVAFQLRDISIEQSNQNKKRYFILVEKDAISWNAESKTLTIFMEYHPLSEAEEKEHGKTEQQRPQKKLNELAEKRVLELVEDADLKVALAKNEKRNNTEKSVLRWRLDHFTRRNTTDFFIHKDLRGFLRRELDFFIKNEVLQLDELVGGKEADLQRHVQRGRVVRDVAEGIIDFLAQIENFQKKLFEKKKFVIRTDYCLTIDRVSEELWDEILANEAQINEWQQLYSLDELLEKDGISNNGVNRDFLKAHPTLVIDTHHFTEDFKWRLLAQFDSLDEALDGILVKSENWQALTLLLEKYREQVKCIYIDPPYNTGSDEFIYRDHYQHSCWLSMMADRLALAKKCMQEDGVIFISIDENEVHNLKHVLDMIFSPANLESIVTWRRRHNQPNDPTKMISKVGEHVLVYSKNSGYLKQTRAFYGVPLSEKRLREYRNPDNDPRGLWESKPWKSGTGQSGSRYKIVSPTGKIFDEEWLGSEQTYQRLLRQGVIYFSKGGDGLPRKKYYLSVRQTEGQSAHNFWGHEDYGSNQEASSELENLFGEANVYSNPKPSRLITAMARMSTSGRDVVLDFFVGSGTTAHGVINLNRQDQGQRRYILVEMGDWFETVLLPRIKKVVFCEKWKGGRPKSRERTSHVLKYHILEQFEDTLNNVELPREADGQEMMKLFGDEYLLRYMLDFETQSSPSLLNLDMFKEPFSYQLKVQERDEIRERTIDLVETFNYLLGISVKKMMAFQDNGHPYRVVLGEKNGNRLVIIWRPTTELENNDEALMRDKTYIQETILLSLLGEMKPDRILINGISFVEDAEAIEPEFKRLMFSGVV